MSRTERQQNLLTLINESAHELTIPVGSVIKADVLLCAIAQQESSFALNAIPRWEFGYAAPNYGAKRTSGGNYWKTSPHVKELTKAHGDFAACSYGPWQCLFIALWEVGYRGTPEELKNDDALNLHWAIRLMNRRVFFNGSVAKGAKTVEEVGDAWNTGNHRDSIKNLKYEEELRKHYTNWMQSI